MKDTSRHPGPTGRGDVTLPATDPTANPTRREGLDPGAFVGRKSERQAETIPGGVTSKDERISAVASRPGPKSEEGEMPAGHRGGADADDDAVREAGQNR